LSAKKTSKAYNRPVKVPGHKHCPICGNAIDIKQDYCSPKCENEHRKKKKNIERLNKISYLVLTIFILTLLISVLLGLR